MNSTTVGNVLSFPIIESIRERDIDLLILEELYSNTGFEKLFLNLLDKKDFEFVLAHHSVVSFSLGETDVWIKFKNRNDKYLFVLLENKIDAEFQPNQYERYEQKAEQLRKEGHEVFTVLTAPIEYLRKTSKFIYRISYEDIMNWFSKNDARSIYKRSVINLAITKPVGSEPDELVTKLWFEYYAYINENISELRMDVPDGKPSNSSFVYFKPKWLPIRSKLVHKMNKGYLDLQLSGVAHQYEALVEKYTSKLHKDMEIVVTGKSIAFRVEVPVIFFTESFESQINKMKEFSKAYFILKSWNNINMRS
jgi:hypothetical protein